MTDIRILEQNVADAEAALAAARAEVRATERIAYNIRQAERAASAVALPDSAFIDEQPGRRHQADYILPLGEEYSKVNVLDPDSFPFGGPEWMVGSVVYVMAKPERTRPTRVFISGGGSVGADWRIGNVWRCRHDQTNALLGTYTVVGIVVYGADGEVIRTVGETPNVKMAAAVFK
jgi:hypothetical protein